MSEIPVPVINADVQKQSPNSIIFSEIVKYRGFYKVLDILYSYQDEELTNTQLIKRLKEMGSYYNAYLRIRTRLFDLGLIKFYLTEEISSKKAVKITEKGIKVWNLFLDIFDILEGREVD
ncbi:MAG: hypothetical protein ACTSUI_00590 [Promethearchaeota archaeon]